MFMYPDPPPLDYCLTDVGPTFVADGIFYHGEPPPATHKYVAKQLTPIKRKISDPLAPVQELDARTLNRNLEKAKESYVANPGKDKGIIFETLSIMPKQNLQNQGRNRFTYAVFPRSAQFELSSLKEKRAKDLQEKPITRNPCTRKENAPVEHDEPCGLLKPPVWWKEKPGKPRKLPLGNINDYAYEKLENREGDVKISEKLELDHPMKYIPGDIHRLTNPEDTSMKDALDRADSFKVVLKSIEEPSLSDGVDIEKRTEVVEKQAAPATSKCHDSVPKALKTDDSPEKTYEKDLRWQPLQETMDFPTNRLQRERELRNLTKPFSHDLHTWYTKNKPAKLILPVKHSGKKAIPERRFSHL